MAPQHRETTHFTVFLHAQLYRENTFLICSDINNRVLTVCLLEKHVMKNHKTKSIFDGTKNETNMKQTLIMLSLSMVFASCGTGGNDQTAVLQKKGGQPDRDRGRYD